MSYKNTKKFWFRDALRWMGGTLYYPGHIPEVETLQRWHTWMLCRLTEKNSTGWYRYLKKLISILLISWFIRVTSSSCIVRELQNEKPLMREINKKTCVIQTIAFSNTTEVLQMLMIKVTDSHRLDINNKKLNRWIIGKQKSAECTVHNASHMGNVINGR